MIAHIRRTDEVNVTECGKLTAYDAVVTDAPVAVGRGVAIFPDVEWPAQANQCRACVKAYESPAR
jgi:hypothetical protein